MVDKPAPAVAGGDASADRASLLAGVLARYSALPLPSGDAATLDAYLSRLIRCPAFSVLCQNGPEHAVLKSRSAHAACVLHL